MKLILHLILGKKATLRIAAITTCLILALLLTRYSSTPTLKSYNPQQAIDNGDVVDVHQTQDNTAMLSSMNLNTVAFKNMGDLAFVWQGLLYVLDGKTGEVKQLTESGQAMHPVWSFDGQWIAFIQATDPATKTGQLWLIHRDGQQAHQVQGILEPATGQNFSWSPTADVLVVSGQDGLWLVPVDGKLDHMISGSIFSANWSPDGKSIAYNVGGNVDDDLYTVNVNSDHTVKHITVPNAGIKVAAWWSDGNGLLYWLDPQHGASLAADGLDLWSLKFNDAKPKLVSTGLIYRDWLSFSPNGQLLMVTGGDRIVWAQKSLTITNLESGSSKKFPNPDGCVAIDPSLSPDGRHIIFVAAKNLGNNVGGFSKPDELADWVATRTLWIENADGSGAHPLKSAGLGVYQPAWSKDGTHILYVQNNSLWMIGVSDENQEKILGPFPDWKDQFGFYGYIRHDDFSWFQP